ncbi:MAG: gene transfer agent family protein [Rubellimicrobium sp.]|nr:gene transfer agent family protein [Rubellimicrobium sp.]
MNPWAGEVSLCIDGVARRCRLTLGALAEMEAGLQGDGTLDLVGRIEAGRFTSRDIMAVVVAGLRGGGWEVTAPDLLAADIAGGPVAAARAAAQMLARAFAPDA